MLQRIIKFSVENKLLIILSTLLMVTYGVVQLKQLPIDAVPDITNNQVQVITVAPSLGATDIERFITFPVEQSCSNIPGTEEIRSFSRFGLSIITIVFKDNIDIYWARQQVSERIKISGEQIPSGFGSPKLAPVTTGLGEIFQYVIRPKKGFETKYTTTDLRSIQDWLVRRQLLNVKGVADVSSFGGNVKQFEVSINPVVLKAHNISINDIISAIENNNQNTGGAYLEKQNNVLFIRTEGLVKNPEDLRLIRIPNLKETSPLFLKDVAEIKIGHAIRYGAMTYNDEGEAAGGIVMMLKGENSSIVINEVKDRIEQIKKILPEGIEIEPFLDRSKMVNNAISTVTKNLLEGALIVIFILVLFLGNFRAGFIVASVIPLSMLFAVIMMNIFGVSGNLMSLGALDFGLIVDGAVIIVEAVLHTFSRSGMFIGGNKISPTEIDNSVKDSAGKMMSSAVFGQLIILVVYLPIFSLEGIEGKMFKPMAQTVVFALAGAFLLSLTYVPMISALLLGKGDLNKRTLSDKIMDKLIAIHQFALTRVLKRPKTAIITSLVAFIAAVFLFSTLGGEFIPELPEGDFAIETRVLPGSNLQTSIDVITKSSKLLMNKFPEIEKIVGKTGSGEIPTDPMPIDASDMMVILKERDKWVSAKTWDELSAKITETLNEIPDAIFSVQYPVAMRFNELISGAKQDVVCKIFGENIDTLSKYSKKLSAIVSEVEGTESIYTEPIDGLPQLIINFNREALAQYNISVADANKIVNASGAGQACGMLFEDEKRFEIVVRMDEKLKRSEEDIRNLLIPAAGGIQVPLYQVADVRVKESINQIQREEAKRRIIVGFNIKDRDVQSVVNDLQKKVNQKLNLPSGYYVTYGGSFENLMAAKKRLMFAVPLALILIFILLYFAFHSVKQAALIYSAIPLSAIGGILFLALRGMPFSISAGIGFIALFGVAVLNGLVLIAEFNRIKKEGETDLIKIVLKGTSHRLRPVLMTAFVASLGFLPMAISNGEGAEVQRPLATVVIGGLLLATFLTLFVLPVLFVLFEKLSIKKMNAKNSVASLLIFVLFLSGHLGAQNSIDLKSAVDSALKNNLQIRSEKLKSEYQKKIKQASFDLPQTTISYEYGQYNSIYRDNKAGISQSANFPLVYVKQKALQNEIYQASQIGIQLKQAEIKKQVEALYFLLVSLNEKKMLLQWSDSVYSAYLEKTTQRFNRGDITALEKANAEIQSGQIKVQKKQIETEIEIQLLKFQLVINTQKPYMPDPNYSLSLNSSWSDSSDILKHPLVKLQQQDLLIARAHTKYSRSKHLPDLFFGYYSQTIQGFGADNIFYTKATRFNSVQLGLGIPLFFMPTHAKVRAGKLAEEISKNEHLLTKQTLLSEYKSAKQEYLSRLDLLRYYENNAMPGAKTIMETAHKQLAGGQINYIEWTQLINSTIQIRASYTDAKHELNQAILKLNYLTGN